MTYKRASGRLRLLEKLRKYVDLHTSNIIYNSMVLPTLTYCGILNLKHTTTQSNKLSSLQARAEKVISRNQSETIPVLSPVNECKIRSCYLVRKVVNGDICDAMTDYFLLQQHEKCTRNNKYYVTLPFVKTEYARKGFFCMGAKTFNELPLDLRQIANIHDFKRKLKLYYYSTRN